MAVLLVMRKELNKRKEVVNKMKFLLAVDGSEHALKGS